MSQWRRIVHLIHERGPMSLPELAVYVHTEADLYGAAACAAKLGLINRPGNHCDLDPRPITLTQRGIDFAEGRLTQVARRPGGRYWQATWLMALPRGVRIEPGPLQRAA